jgi:hypothetical protein
MTLRARGTGQEMVSQLAENATTCLFHAASPRSSMSKPAPTTPDDSTTACVDACIAEGDC